MLRAALLQKADTATTTGDLEGAVRVGDGAHVGAPPSRLEPAFCSRSPSMLSRSPLLLLLLPVSFSPSPSSPLLSPWTHTALVPAPSLLLLLLLLLSRCPDLFSPLTRQAPVPPWSRPVKLLTRPGLTRPGLTRPARHRCPMCFSCHPCVPRGVDTPSWHSVGDVFTDKMGS